MSLSFLTPFFLAGTGLLVAPWIIHHIRRPEREPMRFSSLMFLPDVQKEVIERRRLQHILLMLLRMLMLALLAFAFARPILKSTAAIVPFEDRARHVILIDNSYSMSTLDWLDKAKAEALDILSSVGEEAAVGVVAFADRPVLMASLDTPEDANTTSLQRARTAINAIEPTQEKTKYLPAMQRAQEMLLQTSEEENVLLTVHVISDFQKAGMPERAEGWKLSPRVQFNPVEIGESAAPNVSIQDLGLTVDSQGRLRLRAKIKNWIDATTRACDVALVTNGETSESQTVDVPPGNAARVMFELPTNNARQLFGWLQLDDDALNIDNRRYFAWSAPPKVPTLILGDPQEEVRWPGAWLMQKALPTGADSPWTIDSSGQTDLYAKLGDANPPRVIIATDLKNLTADTAQRLLDFVERGGRLLLALNASVEAGTANTLILEKIGLASDGLMYDNISAYQFSALAWVDLDHPVFIPFRGAQFNNFSQIKFFNHHKLRITDDASARSLARFEADRSTEAPPAMIESTFGDGRVIVWSFGADLEWSDLPKSPRFVPMLHETLAHLADLNEVRTVWTVGDSLNDQSTALTNGELRPDTTTAPAEWSDDDRLTKAGLLTWSNDPQPDRVEAVNVDAGESDGTRISTGEFELRLCAAPDLRRVAGVTRTSEEAELLQTNDGKEFGHFLIVALLLSLLLETAYTRYLSI
jgi:hypothetical protein